MKNFSRSLILFLLLFLSVSLLTGLSCFKNDKDNEKSVEVKQTETKAGETNVNIKDNQGNEVDVKSNDSNTNVKDNSGSSVKVESESNDSVKVEADGKSVEVDY